MDSEYPPEPWDLHGHGYFSIWPVPAWRVPELPGEVTPVTLFGRTLVATAFVDYLPGSVLSYHEVLVGVLVRRGRRPGITITQIWVDSEQSMTGARAMWAIPKQLARFRMSRGPVVRASAQTLAEARVRPGRVGVRMPVPVGSRSCRPATRHWSAPRRACSACSARPVPAGGSIRAAHSCGLRPIGPC
jgi:hypothetical protein